MFEKLPGKASVSKFIFLILIKNSISLRNLKLLIFLHFFCSFNKFYFSNNLSILSTFPNLLAKIIHKEFIIH